MESAGPRKQPCTSGCWSLSGLDTALAFLTDRSPCSSSSLWPGWGFSDSRRRGVLVKGHRAWFIILAFLWAFTIPVFHCYQRLRDEGNRFKQHMVRGEQGGRLRESQCPKAWLKRPQCDERVKTKCLEQARGEMGAPKESSRGSYHSLCARYNAKGWASLSALALK